MNEIEYYSPEFTIFACRALIGDIRNMTSDCLENLRERAQYMHFFRENYKKISEILQKWSPEVSKESQPYTIISEIYTEYRNSPRATKENSQELSQKLISILIKYGYKPSRDI